MRYGTSLCAALAAFFLGCVHPITRISSALEDARAQAAERYQACVFAELDSNSRALTPAEERALAAHARCWTAWDHYGKVTEESFFFGARSAAERQLAHDKTRSHLRDFELDTRRIAADYVILQAMMPAPR